MATSPIMTALHHLRKAVLGREIEATSDGQLLKRFLDGRDQKAFEALVLRHGAMVLGVCRRVLGNIDDAEDAFQAAFLILVRKARSIGKAELLGNWLYGVAYRTALDAKAKAARRRCHEKQVKDMPHPAVEPDSDRTELVALLDRELNRLPDKYRVPVVLCDLEGGSRKEVARQLGLPEGTLSSRLATARKMLAKRLARCGLAISSGAVATALAQQAASACVPTALVASTVSAAAGVATSKAVTTAMVSAKVAGLMEGVLKGMFIQKLKVLTAVFLALAVAGGGLVTYRTGLGAAAAQDEEAAAKAQREAAAKAAAEKAAREAAAKAGRAKESPSFPTPPKAGVKDVAFESVSISIEPFKLFAVKQSESIRVLAGGARGEVFCEYRIAGRPAGGGEPAWDAGFLQHTLDLKRLRRLEELLKKTDWLNAPGHEGKATHTHPTKYTLAVRRKGKTRTVILDGEKDEPYRSLVSFFQGIALQEYLLYRLERLPAKERVDACREIERYGRAESGERYAKPAFEIDLRRYVPTFQRYVRGAFKHSVEELTPALRLLGYLRVESEREHIAALANDRDANVRLAVVEALGALGGKDSVAPLRRMLRSTNEAAWQLIRLGPPAVPGIVEVIENGTDPSEERRPESLDYQRLIRAYGDHWDELPKPIDPRVLDAVRKNMGYEKVRDHGLQYHRKLLKLAGVTETPALSARDTAEAFLNAFTANKPSGVSRLISGATEDQERERVARTLGDLSKLRLERLLVEKTSGMAVTNAAAGGRLIIYLNLLRGTDWRVGAMVAEPTAREGSQEKQFRQSNPGAKEIPAGRSP